MKQTQKIYLPVDAIIFDMDGVITHTMPDHFRAWSQVLKNIGLSVSRHDIYKREGQRGITSIQELFRENGKTLSKQTAADLLRKKEVLFKKIVRRRFVPGSRLFIQALNRERIRLGLVTGTSRDEMLRILPKNLRNCFDIIVTGNDTVSGKPHPAPYRRVLKKLRIPPDQTVVIENAPLGIRSAKAAGCRCLALSTSLPKQYLGEADHIFDSFQTLRRRINFIPRECRPGKDGPR